jgi:general L-amino acid transport system substrate-binding protein
MRFFVALVSLILAPTVSSESWAGPVLDRIKSQGVIRCGAVSRPGLVDVGSNHVARGLLLDMCRAIGAAVLPPDGRLEFHQYDSPAAFGAVRNGTDDIFFLSASEIIEENLAGKIVPGPTVFHHSISVMVPESSKARHLADLAGEPVCFIQGGNADNTIEAWFAHNRLDFVRMGYQEDVEMDDAYNAQVCHAMAAEATTLAKVRLTRGVNDIHSRIIEEPVEAFPILAATGATDAEWSAIVAWSVHTLVSAGAPATHWAAGGADSLPVEAPELGLTKGWRERVVRAAGPYAAMYGRNLGDGSIYKLSQGLNGPWRTGGLLLPPHAE